LTFWAKRYFSGFWEALRPLDEFRELDDLRPFDDLRELDDLRDFVFRAATI